MWCGRSSSNPSSDEIPASNKIMCSNECQIAKRNVKLADALGINPEDREKERAVAFPERLVAFSRANPKFLVTVEKAFAECVL